MINRIEIKLQEYSLLIDNRKCYINNKEIKLTDEDINNILRIIRNWNNNYQNNKIIGESHDYIIINDKDTYTFNNEYPNNIRELIDYIGEMYER